MAGGTAVDVAVVGTGLAGLLTAHLIQRDPRRRYRVTVFEKVRPVVLDTIKTIGATRHQVDEHAAALGGSSVLLKHDDNGQTELVDIPMRSFNPGYYHHLVALLAHLRIRSRWNKFLFAFSTSDPAGPYYLHASDRQRLIPPRPPNTPLLEYILRTLFLAICYIWLSVGCFLVDPSEDESIGEYLRRLRVPETFTAHYLFPLLSSVATCTHEAFSRSPALDFVAYKRQIWHSGHYHVEHGIWELEEKLIDGLDVHFGCEIDQVRPTGSAVQMTWRSKEGGEHTTTFKHVILAIPPNAIGRLYPRLRESMAGIPTTHIETHVLKPSADRPQLSVVPRSILSKSVVRPDVQTITLESHTHNDASITAARQLLSNGAQVVTSIVPQKHDPHTVISRASFTRTQRTVASRRMVNSIFQQSSNHTSDETKAWRNGEDGIWLAGAWCWDGFVLLEGCVVSALRVAQALDVDVPWKL